MFNDARQFSPPHIWNRSFPSIKLKPRCIRDVSYHSRMSKWMRVSINIDNKVEELTLLSKIRKLNVPATKS